MDTQKQKRKYQHTPKWFKKKMLEEMMGVGRRVRFGRLAPQRRHRSRWWNHPPQDDIAGHFWISSRFYRKRVVQELTRLFDAQDTSEGRAFSWDYSHESFVRVVL